MNKEVKIGLAIAGVALIALAVQRLTQPAARPARQGCGNGGNGRGRWSRGDMWAKSVAMAPRVDDGNAFPAANIFN